MRQRRTPPPGLPVIGIGIILAALMLRPAATSVGPVLAEIRGGVGMGATGAALLAALPGLSFALAGSVAARLGHRIGPACGLALAAVIGAVGLLGRSISTSAVPFLALSVVGLCGAGLGNVLVPMAIKQRFGLHAHRWTGIYVILLPIGALLPQVLAPGIITAGGSWRQSLALWGWGAVVSAVPWIAVVVNARWRPGSGPEHGDVASGAVLARGEDRGEAESPARSAPGPGLADMARNPRARSMGLFFGIQSMHAYVTFAYLPQIFRDAGLSLASAALLLAGFSLCGTLAGLMVPTIVARARDVGPWMLGLIALLVPGYLGLLLAPTVLAWLWVVLLGLAGCTFQVVLVLVTARTRDYRVTAALSGFTQSLGYAMASAGPFLIGWLYGVAGGWKLPLIVLLASVIPMAWFGWRICKPGYLDDELTHQAASLQTV
ncbi:CynX/NimT family MFS transporter [Actinomyces viscosus]|uniref:MFS transporter n=1 Tax=Actinomyces viscosus TaxID=1656 RepID=UPI0036F42F94